VKIHFFEPPVAQKAGGLDAAIRSLQNALLGLGHEVSINARAIAAGDAAAVHFHGLWQRNFPALARECRRLGVPYIVSPHGMLEPWARRHKWWKKLPYFHLVEKRWIAGAACILATGNPEAQRLRAIFPGKRIESLPLGLTDTARPDYTAAREGLGWRDDEIILLYLSRIHEKKGLDMLLTALAELRESERMSVSSSRLVIVGPEEQPEYAARCRDFVARNSARLPRTEWRGAVWGAERWRYFQGADLFCLPTHSENFGLAVLEACQVGTPVLTTTETPWTDALGGGRGFIAKPEVADIRAQLARFFVSPRNSAAERDALAAWAWENFDWKELAPRYAALYAGVC